MTHTQIHREMNKEQTVKTAKRLHKLKMRDRRRPGKLKLWEKFFGRKTYHVIMRRKNGNKNEYILKCDSTAVFFDFENKVYFIMQQGCVWNATLKCIDIEYHEGFSLPLVMEFSEKDILDNDTKDHIAELNMTTSIYPDVAKESIYAKNIKAGMQAGTLADKYKMLIVGMWLTFGLVTAHFLLWMNSNGMLPGTGGAAP